MEPIEARLRLRPKGPGERRAPSPAEFPLKTPPSELANRETTSERIGQENAEAAGPLVRFADQRPPRPNCRIPISTLVAALHAHARYASLNRKLAAECWVLLGHIHIRPPGRKQRKNSVQSRWLLSARLNAWTERKLAGS